MLIKISMRYMHLLFGALVLAGLWACNAERDAQPVTYKAPEVEFTMTSDVIDAVVGKPVSFSARVISGDKVSVSWFIDEVLTSSSQSFNYVFEDPGVHTVLFEARNGAGVVSRNYTVSVSDRLSIHLSVGDSTVVKRLQLNNLMVAAIVEYGQDVTHEWSLDGVVVGHEALFGPYKLTEIRDYEVRYRGFNSLNEDAPFEKTFTVAVQERPLEVSFSLPDAIVGHLWGKTLAISTVVLFGDYDVQQKWYLKNDALEDAQEVEMGSAPNFSYRFMEEGTYTLRYEAANAKAERVSRTWKVNVTKVVRLLDDCEGAAISSWFRLKENNPGVEQVENPFRTPVNPSAKCLRDMVYGSGGTSGYFNLLSSDQQAMAGFDVSEYSGIRFMVHFNNNRYYPRMDINGSRRTPVSQPAFTGDWEVLEFLLPEGETFDKTKNITFRPLLQENGQNIPNGDTTAETDNRTVYIDNIEFIK